MKRKAYWCPSTVKNANNLYEALNNEVNDITSVSLATIIACVAFDQSIEDNELRYMGPTIEEVENGTNNSVQSLIQQRVLTNKNFKDLVREGSIQKYGATATIPLLISTLEKDSLVPS